MKGLMSRKLLPFIEFVFCKTFFVAVADHIYAGKSTNGGTIKVTGGLSVP